MKFEEAYYQEHNKLIKVTELSQLRKQDIVKFKQANQALFCPECHVAKIDFVNDNPPYLRSYPNTVHGLNCTLAQDIMSVKERKDFVNASDNDDVIQHQMEAIFLRLINQNSSAQRNEKSPVVLQKNENNNSKNNTTPQRRMPQKCITLPLSERDFNTPKYFYGFVNLKWYKIEDLYYDWLNVFSAETGEKICGLKITNNVYKHLPQGYKDEHTKAYIVFLGELIKESEEKIKCTPRKSSHIFMHYDVINDFDIQL